MQLSNSFGTRVTDFLGMAHFTAQMPSNAKNCYGSCRTFRCSELVNKKGTSLQVVELELRSSGK